MGGAVHVECAFRALAGSVAHQQKVSATATPPNEADPIHLTRREAAVAAYWYSQGRQANGPHSHS